MDYYVVDALVFIAVAVLFWRGRRATSLLVLAVYAAALYGTTLAQGV